MAHRENRWKSTRRLIRLARSTQILYTPQVYLTLLFLLVICLVSMKRESLEHVQLYVVRRGGNELELGVRLTRVYQSTCKVPLVGQPVPEI